MDKKKVIFWEAARYMADNLASTTTLKKPVGKFKTRVSATTKGAELFQGVNKTNEPYKYYALLADKISGRVVWVDKVADKYQGAKLALWIEGEKRLHKVLFKYDAQPCRGLINRLLGAGADIITQTMEIGYWVHPRQNQDGSVKLNDKNEVTYQENIVIKDVPKKIDDFKTFATENGLDWIKNTDAKGVVSYNNSAELKFWDSKIASLQTALLKKGIAVPFTYGSFICSTTKNPSGAANLSEELINLAKARIEEIKDMYEMPYSTAGTNADDIDIEEDDNAEQLTPAKSENPVQSTKSPSATQNVAAQSEDDDLFPFPDDNTSTTSNENIESFKPLEDDDLPF